jgi:hypothetical protein
LSSFSPASSASSSPPLNNVEPIHHLADRVRGPLQQAAAVEGIGEAQALYGVKGLYLWSFMALCGVSAAMPGAWSEALCKGARRVARRCEADPSHAASLGVRGNGLSAGAFGMLRESTSVSSAANHIRLCWRWCPITGPDRMGVSMNAPRLGERVHVRGDDRSFFVMSVDDEHQTANLVTASGTARCVEAVPLGQLLLSSPRDS